MPRSREELDQAAADAEKWSGEMDPAVLADPAAVGFERPPDTLTVTYSRPGRPGLDVDPA